jgi:hypothetical protein
MQKILMLLCCLATLATNAQNSKLMLNTESFRPLLVVVHQADDEKILLNSIADLSEKDRNGYHFLFIYGEKTNQATITRILNETLSKDANFYINKQKIYLLLLKADAPLRAFLSDQAIFADVADMGSGSYGEKVDFAPVLDKMKTKYLWNMDVENIKNSGMKITHKNRRLGVGFVMGMHTQDVFKTDTAFLPSRITKLGISLNYRLSNRWQLMGRIMGSFKLPNQSKLQSSLLSQIDMAAGGEQTVKIEMETHVFVQTSLQANYLFQLHRKVQGFAGVGLARINFLSARLNQETTIDVSNFSPGSGGPPGGLDFGSQDDLPRLSNSFWNPFAAIGLNYKLNKRVSIMANLDYHAPKFGKKVVNGVEITQNTNPFSPGLGLQFTFGKSNVNYNYLNKSKSKNSPRA